MLLSLRSPLSNCHVVLETKFIVKGFGFQTLDFPQLFCRWDLSISIRLSLEFYQLLKLQCLLFFILALSCFFSIILVQMSYCSRDHYAEISSSWATSVRRTALHLALHYFDRQKSSLMPQSLLDVVHISPFFILWALHSQSSVWTEQGAPVKTHQLFWIECFPLIYRLLFSKLIELKIFPG